MSDVLRVPADETATRRSAPTVDVLECVWCSRPCVDRDETGAPACTRCRTEFDARRYQRDERSVRRFVIQEFRAFGALV